MDRQYPATLRRLRQNALTRDLARSTTLDYRQFIQPLFVVEGLAAPQAITGMPGVQRDNIDSVIHQVTADLEAGVRKFLLFCVPQHKCNEPAALNFHFVNDIITALRQRFGQDIWLAVDVCLCSSTTHGHCGFLDAAGARVDNHATVTTLADMSVAIAQAGADCIAPSDMMDGRIRAIREALIKHNHEQTIIMSYAAKFQSNLYGPFRVAADSAPQQSLHTELHNRATYQIDPARPEDALACAQRDFNDGADILMIKPITAYLDVLRDLSQSITAAPWAAYHVSGEYASLALLADAGLTDLAKANVETWTAIRRAGAPIIISYAARRAKQWLHESQN